MSATTVDLWMINAEGVCYKAVIVNYLSELQLAYTHNCTGNDKS